MVAIRCILTTITCHLLVGSAQSTQWEGLARILVSTGIVPEEQSAAVAAQFLLSGANATSIALQQALSLSGVDELKANDPELYYSYGHSPPMYPSRRWKTQP